MAYEPKYTSIDAVRQATGFRDDENFPDDLFTEKISYAENAVDSAVKDTYLLPFAVVPGVIRSIATVLAAYELFMEQYSEEPGDADKSWQKRYDHAMQRLEDIRSLKVNLLDPDTGAELARAAVQQPESNQTSAPLSSDDGNYEPHFTMGRRY
jgi:phage gp36-like protein